MTTVTLDDGYQSISSMLQSAEPSLTSTHPRNQAQEMPSSTQTPPLPNPLLPSSCALTLSGPPSSVTSPLSSRDVSPDRPCPRVAASTNTNATSALRSRQTSTDPSQNRGPALAGSTKPPSAAAIKRALSASNVPDLPGGSSSDVFKPSPTKPTSNSGDNTPRWPVSPRLRSPSPSEDGNSRSRTNILRAQIRKPDTHFTPAVVVQDSSPAPLLRLPGKDEPLYSDPDEPGLSMKPPPRGASGAIPKLETVQEGSLPATPGFEGIETQSFISSKASDEEPNDASSFQASEDLTSIYNTSKDGESGSDGGSKAEGKGKAPSQRTSSTHRSGTVSKKTSVSSLSKTRSELPLRNMTVETETVPSVAQSGLGGQERSTSNRTDSGLRMKPSNETIRPKKERKAPKRKAPSVHSGTGRLHHISYPYSTPNRPDSGSEPHVASPAGSSRSHRLGNNPHSVTAASFHGSEMRMLTLHNQSFRYSSPSTNIIRKASSKADVFEQKVASAVDEANSSDSDATFIYESNPPEHHTHRSRQQHHARTPSMTSMASMGDPRLVMRDPHKNPNKKSSMKFTNPYHNSDADAFILDRSDGTVRSTSVRAGHCHHVGRHGQGRGALPHFVPDSDSSMAQSSRAPRYSSRQASQPSSPRFQTFHVGNGYGETGKKHGEFSVYDMDSENVADDERAPLIPTGRAGPRTRTPRRRDSLTLRQLERRQRSNGCCRRFAGCLVLSILLLVAIFSFVGLVFATTKPLTSVLVESIQNVVVSQDELMLDVNVGAVNPNIIGVTVNDMDVIIFAKSKHVGSDKWWREHGNDPKDDEEDWRPVETPDVIKITGGTDEGTDPIEGEPRTMSLGHIFHFDSPLTFDGSFFQRHRAHSIGEIRLQNPGNKTEVGGSERWEEVLQYPFEIIIKGNLKYTLPLSTREHRVPITGSYYHDPDIEKKNLGTRRTQDPTRPKPVLLLARGRYDARALEVSRRG